MADLEEKMGKVARITGEVLQIQQTSGPTIFIITDETGKPFIENIANNRTRKILLIVDVFNPKNSIIFIFYNIF